MRRKAPSRQCRVPNPYYDQIAKLSKALNIPITDTFIMRDKILAGQFQARRKHQRSQQRWVWELWFDE